MNRRQVFQRCVVLCAAVSFLPGCWLSTGPHYPHDQISVRLLNHTGETVHVVFSSHEPREREQLIFDLAPAGIFQHKVIVIRRRYPERRPTAVLTLLRDTEPLHLVFTPDAETFELAVENGVLKASGYPTPPEMRRW